MTTNFSAARAPMNEHRLARVAQVGLRLALGTAFLSAVAGRFGLWGRWGGNWSQFVDYAGQVNWFLPPSLVPASAIASTVLEIGFGFLLVSGWKVKQAAYAANCISHLGTGSVCKCGTAGL